MNEGKYPIGREGFSQMQVDAAATRRAEHVAVISDEEAGEWLNDDHGCTTYPDGRELCDACDEPWPCGYATLLIERRSLKRKLEAIRDRTIGFEEGFILPYKGAGEHLRISIHTLGMQNHHEVGTDPGRCTPCFDALEKEEEIK